MAFSSAGNELDAVRTQREINLKTKEYKQFCADNGLAPQTERANVDGFRRIGTSNLKKLETDAIIEAIENGEWPLTINVEKFNRHVLGNYEYKPGRSYLTISLEEAQNVVNENYQNAKYQFDRNFKWKHTAVIKCNKIIGCNINNKNNKITETDNLKVHFSKTGTHIVPTLIDGEKKL